MNELIRRGHTKPEFRLNPEGKIVGRAIVFNQLSLDLGGYQERILPQALDRTLKSQDEVWFYLNHDNERPLGRRSTGTLQLVTDDEGLLISCEPSATSWGKDALEVVRHGDAQGMSFGFYILNSRRVEEGGQAIEEVSDLQLIECSLVYDPAYPQTSVALRSRPEELPDELLRQYANHYGNFLLRG